MTRTRRPEDTSEVIDVAASAQATTAARRDLVEKELFETASKLFAEKGFAGTTLQDIAKALGVSRPSLYHYIRSKDELLERVVRDMAAIADDLVAATLADTGPGPIAKLHKMIDAIVDMVGSHPAHFRILLQNEQRLDGELAERHRSSRDRLVETLIGIIEEGKAKALFRPVNTQTAAFSILGACNWVVFWHHDGDLASVADDIAELGVRGLAVPDQNSVESPRQLIDLAREALDRLEATLETANSTHKNDT
jgi:AcrR family transcriptional regulator